MISVCASFAVDLMFVLVATLLHYYEGGSKGGGYLPRMPMHAGSANERVYVCVNTLIKYN